MPIRNKSSPGDFLRVCDRTGFTTYASKTRREWNNLIVRSDVWEIRHPQDFVRGKPDRQSVGQARPPPGADTFVGPLITEANADHSAGDTSITVLDTTRMGSGDTLEITHDDKEVKPYIVQSIDSAATLTLTSGLLGAVSDGNQILDNSAVSENTV